MVSSRMTVKKKSTKDCYNEVEYVIELTLTDT